MQSPQKTARVMRHVKTIAIVGMWTFVLYVAIKAAVTSWFGAVFWGTFFFGLGVYIWRETKEVVRRKKFDAHLSPEQLSAVVKLREMVKAVEAHTKHSHTWKKYLGREHWTRAELPDNPSLAEIEIAFKKCEDVLPRFDINLAAATSKLLTASRAQKDTELEKTMLENHIPFIEHALGKESDVLIQLIVRVGLLHFAGEDYKQSAKELSQALRLQEIHSQKDQSSKMLMNHQLLMLTRKMLAMAHMMADNTDAAEAVLLDLLPVLEEEEGVLNTEPLGTQLIRGMLISVYTKQGWKAWTSPKEQQPTNLVARYLRDALVLVAVHPSFYSHNLKHVGRLFIWAGRDADGKMAFRLANAIFEASRGSSTPQRNCLCASTNAGEEAHALRTCDACSKPINLDERWFFCKTCVDVDLCASCYTGSGQNEERGWEDVDKFPRKCLGHEFFEVREDEKEKSVLVQVWVADVVRRLTAEIESGVKQSEASC